MDVERTIEFILQMQAKAEARMDRWDERAAKAEARAEKAEARMDRSEVRMDRSEARMDKFDKRLVATGKLVQTGMKMLVPIQKSQRELVEAQKKTDRKLDRLIDSWTKRPANGHGSKN